MTEAARSERGRDEVLVLASEWRVGEQGTRPDPEIRLVGTDNVLPLRLLAPPAPAPTAIDRDELRRLVSEALREELRSEFGRDLTGAMRRFVRSEVARILSVLRPR